jgi:hypothetical protein
MPVTFSTYLAHLMQEKPVQISTIFLFEYHWVPIVKAMFFVGYLRHNRYVQSGGCEVAGGRVDRFLLKRYGL